VTKNAGTADQTIELHTVNVNQNETIVVTMAQGRRKELVSIPAPSLVRPGQDATRKEKERSQQTINRLRAMSSPSSSQSAVALTGGVGAQGTQQPLPSYSEPQTLPQPGLTAQKRIASETDGGLEFKADVEALLTKDGPAMRLRVAPVWSTINGERANVKLSIIPGAGR